MDAKIKDLPMQFSLESPSSLGRKLTVTVDASLVASAYNQKIIELIPQVKLDGFRPGKVPTKIIEQRYGAGVKEQVAQDVIKDNLQKAFEENALRPAGAPTIEPGPIKIGQDFEFSATFEVVPEIVFNELTGETVDMVVSDVTDNDIESMVTKLRQHSCDWVEVSRACQDSDKITIDFAGSIDGEPFDGGKAEGFALTLGDGKMIPGFESQIMGMTPESQREIDVTFPENYGAEELAGKDAKFQITLHRVEEPQLPEVDEAFISRFNIGGGTVEAFYETVRSNMERELERKLYTVNRDAVLEAVVQKNPIELPKVMVDSEIDTLRKELLQSMFGDKPVDASKLPNLDNPQLVEAATKRAHVGLLFMEYISLHKIEADQAQVDEKISKLAQSYEDPQAFIDWHRRDANKRQAIANELLESLVVDTLRSHATVNEVRKTYDEVMQADNREVGENSSQTDTPETKEEQTDAE